MLMALIFFPLILFSNIQYNADFKFTFSWILIDLFDPNAWNIPIIPESSLQLLSSPKFPPRSDHSDFFHHQLLLPVLELHVNGITYFFCIWFLLLNIWSLRFFRDVLLVALSFDLCSILRYTMICLPIFLLIDWVVSRLVWIKLLWTITKTTKHKGNDKDKRN